MNKTLLSLLVAAAMAPAAQAAGFTAGDVAIYRVGTGSGALSSAATAVFVDEYTANGSFVQSIAMPTLASGGNLALTASGSATSEGLLTRSADGQSLVLTGYAASTGTSSIASSTVARVIGVVGANGGVNTSTSLGTSFSGNNIRSAVSTDGTQLWAAGANGGIVTTALGSTANGSPVSVTSTNNRQLEIFNGQLYDDTSSGSSLRVASVGTGTPTTPSQSMTALPGLPTSTGSPYAFFMADLNPGVAGLDTLYIADDAAGLLKYSFNGTSWSAKGSIATTGLRGLTGSIAADGSVTLFGTSASTLYSFVDTAGSAGTLNGGLTTLATAAANTAFRGVALAPTAAAAVPEPQSYALMLSGLLAVGFVARRRREG
jgi:hypothetical protein